jgi:hypothetical protein
MRRTFADNLAAATATSQRTVVRPAANPSGTPRGRPAGEVWHTPFVRRYAYVKTVPKYHVVVEQPDPVRGYGAGRFIATTSHCRCDCAAAGIGLNKAPKAPEQNPFESSCGGSTENKNPDLTGASVGLVNLIARAAARVISWQWALRLSGGG